MHHLLLVPLIQVQEALDLDLVEIRDLILLRDIRDFQVVRTLNSGRARTVEALAIRVL